MAVQGLQEFSSVAEIPSFAGASGIGVIGGVAYLRPSGAAPFPLGGPLAGIGATVRTVDAALSTEINAIYATIQDAVDAALAGDTIQIAAGAYDETVTIPRTDANGDALNNLTLVGIGGRGAVYIEPSTEDAAGMLVHADDVTLINVGVAAEDETAGNFALTVTGTRFRAYQCKIEGAASQVVIGPGTIAQEAAGTRGRGADSLFLDCEFCWGTNGITFTSSDYGACTQAKVIGCLFHNLTGDEIDENDVGVIGAVRDAWIVGNVLANQEDGTEPTKFVDLDSAGSTGVIAQNIIANPTNASAQIGIAAGVIYVANLTEAGVTTARPS